MLPLEVEKVIRGGVNTAVLKVCAEVCLRCGLGVARGCTLRRLQGDSRVEGIKAKLERQETSEFQAVGVAFKVV